jgi:hypothetical protein
MSYYNLPKIYSLQNININPTIEYTKIKTYTSHSLYNYYNDIMVLLNNCIYESNNIFDSLSKDINPYEYIFSKVPGSNLSVSKLLSKSNLFYDFLEIFNTLNIFDICDNKNMNCIHISKNYLDSVECIKLLREHKSNNNICFEEIDDDISTNISNNIGDKRCEFIFYEIENHTLDNLNSYILNLIQVIIIICKYQMCNGNCIIKIGHMFHKPIIDILYILSSMYDKIYIIKPHTSNIITFEKYIVCKNFIFNENNKELYKTNYLKLEQFITNYSVETDQHISKIIDYDLPYYFMNKIDDVNIIIGQQQLESIDQVINIFKNKNKEDRIDSFRKINIQKSINWCEKFKIPCNKFSEKSNIFLPLKNTKEYNTEENNEELT